MKRLALSLAFMLSALLAAQAAQAGPWLKEQGKTFVSQSVYLKKNKDFGTSTYIEHGWREDLTLGVDIGSANSHLGISSGSLTVFVRRPLTWGREGDKWVYEVGAGTAWVTDIWLPHLKAGLSWGRGIDWGGRNGWAVVDTALYLDLTQGRTASKIDSTLGLNFTDRTSGMLQLYLAHTQGEFFATIAPSVVFRPGKRKFRVQVGTESALSDMADTAIKLGIWREF